MKSNDKQKRFADSLLRQDAPLSEIKLKEYRMSLEEKLDMAARNERRRPGVFRSTTSMTSCARPLARLETARKRPGGSRNQR